MLIHAELRTDQADLENKESGKSLPNSEMSPTFSKEVQKSAYDVWTLDVQLTTVADLEKEGKAGPSPSAQRRRRRRGRCTRHSRPSRRKRSTRARTSPSRTSGQGPLRVRFIFRRNSVNTEDLFNFPEASQASGGIRPEDPCCFAWTCAAGGRTRRRRSAPARRKPGRRRPARRPTRSRCRAFYAKCCQT